MRLQSKLIELANNGKAILAANFYNLETLASILEAARKENSPVILQLSEGSIQYIGASVAAQMARKASEIFGVETWLHLDHGKDQDIIKTCLDNGFDSVMIDGSEFPLEENIRITSQVVQTAKPYSVNVEAELGYVAKLNQDQQQLGFTDTDEAKTFVDETGITALAVAIGSAHGFYKETPNLDMDLLRRIKAKVHIPLVLHGSSGIPDAMLQEAIRNGITKVNLATETKKTFMFALKDELNHTEDIDLRNVFPKASNKVTELIQYKMKLLNDL